MGRGDCEDCLVKVDGVDNSDSDVDSSDSDVDSSDSDTVHIGRDTCAVIPLVKFWLT